MANADDASTPRSGVQRPIDLAFETGADLPRLLGELAGIVERRTACVVEQGRALLGGLGLLPARPPHVRATMPPTPTPAAKVTTLRSGGGPATEPTTTPAATRQDDSDLPIPAYDSLSASQVVPRLASLERDELELIRSYEEAGRARRTILNRIEQLRSA
jgi:hypothetical protein